MKVLAWTYDHVKLIEFGYTFERRKLYAIKVSIYCLFYIENISLFLLLFHPPLSLYIYIYVYMYVYVLCVCTYPYNMTPTSNKWILKSLILKN